MFFVLQQKFDLKKEAGSSSLLDFLTILQKRVNKIDLNCKVGTLLKAHSNDDSLIWLRVFLRPEKLYLIVNIGVWALLVFG